MHDDGVENVCSAEHIQHNGCVPISRRSICESQLPAFYYKYNKIGGLKQNVDKVKNYQFFTQQSLQVFFVS
jgi:hypothetical protein